MRRGRRAAAARRRTLFSHRDRDARTARDDNMELREQIDVYTVFTRRGHKPQPVKFRWDNRVYTVREITYQWESTTGATKLLHFAVRDDADLFELVFNTRDLTWELRGIENVIEPAPLPVLRKARDA